MAKRKGGKKGGGAGFSGVKNIVVSAITFALIIAGIFAWMRVNDINSPRGVYDYFKSWSDHVAACGAADLQWNCDNPRIPEPGSGESNPEFPDQGDSSQPTSKKPSTNDGSSSQSPKSNSGDPQQPPASSAPKEEMLVALEKVREGEPQEINYVRGDWKHWAGYPCDTRRVVLERDGINVVVEKTDSSCDIVSGTWVSPFDDKEFTEARGLDIDHIVPLSFAARHGGQNWTADKKESFANDQSNLLAVSAKENRKKGDKGPSGYMPKRSFQCEYSKIWTATLLKYDLTATNKDLFSLKDGLQKCGKGQ